MKSIVFAAHFDILLQVMLSLLLQHVNTLNFYEYILSEVLYKCLHKLLCMPKFIVMYRVRLISSNYNLLSFKQKIYSKDSLVLFIKRYIYLVVF